MKYGISNSRRVRRLASSESWNSCETRRDPWKEPQLALLRAWMGPALAWSKDTRFPHSEDPGSEVAESTYGMSAEAARVRLLVFLLVPPAGASTSRHPLEPIVK